MQTRLAALLLVSTAFTAPAFAADIPVSSRVDAVTVYPSGAEITRIAEAKLEAGEHTLIFEGLPGDLDTETLRVEGTSEGQVEIGSVDSKMIYVPSAETDAERKRLEREMEVLQDERNRLDQAVSDAEYQKNLMQQLASGIIPQPVKDVEFKPFGATELGGLLDLVSARLQVFSKIIFDSRLRQREIDKLNNDLSTELAQLAPREEARMVVSVHLAAPAAAQGTFKLKYRIASAGWRPIYNARLTSPDKNAKAKIDLVRRAEVMQGTTENWTDVALTLSTARPVGATAAPDLVAWQLAMMADQLARGDGSLDQMQSSKAIAPAAEPLMAEQSLGKEDDTRRAKRANVLQLQALVEVAGFQALYNIAGKVSIDNTGTAKKVRIGSGEIDAELSARAVPKLDPNAYLTAAFTLNGDTPLLPGPVMLYRDGVYMGQGLLPMLSPGEESKLGFGADDLIKVKRAEVRRNIGEEGIISTSNVDERAYDITVKNLHDYAVGVTVLDQMPFSAMEDVTVETLPGMTPPTVKDVDKKRGVLAWSFNLEPKAEKIIKHGFKTAWPEDMQVGMN